MPIAISRFTAADADRWDDFISHSRNGTIFHMRRFLGYHPPDRFQDFSLLFSDGNRIRALLPAAREGSGFVSHPGATYGGLVLAENGGVSCTFDCIEALLQFLRKEGCRSASFLRITPAPLHRAYADDQEYALQREGFRLSRFELGSILPLDGHRREDILSLFDTEFRNQVRQAERAGVNVEIGSAYESFWPILESTLGGRHAVKPTHTLTEMRTLASLFPDRFRLFGASKGGKFIGGIVTVDVTEYAVYTKYMAQDFSFQKDRPLNALLAAVVRDCIDRGKRVLDLGVSMAEGGRGINEGLFAFKEGAGARCVRRESYSIDL